jgi:hypothetical protein
MDDVQALLAEIAPSSLGSNREVCEVLVRSLKRRAPSELEDLATRFERAGCPALAAMCRTIAGDQRTH